MIVIFHVDATDPEDHVAHVEARRRRDGAVDQCCHDSARAARVSPVLWQRRRSGAERHAEAAAGFEARDLGLDFEPIEKEATSGDYENLLNVLDSYFGDLVIFER